MRVRPTWKVPTAKQAVNFVSDFDRPSFGTLRERGASRDRVQFSDSTATLEKRLE
jgi:hypothetical protein